MAHLIDIRDRAQGKNYLDVTLADILPVLEPEGRKLIWSLVYLQALGTLADGREVPELEHDVYTAPYGVQMSWNEVVDLSIQLNDIYDIVLIGNHESLTISPSAEDHVIYAGSEMVVELIDSGLWRVYAKNEAIIENLIGNFNDV